MVDNVQCWQELCFNLFVPKNFRLLCFKPFRLQHWSISLKRSTNQVFILLPLLTPFTSTTTRSSLLSIGILMLRTFLVLNIVAKRIHEFYPHGQLPLWFHDLQNGAARCMICSYAKFSALVSNGENTLRSPLPTAPSNGWDRKFALRPRNISQDGIDHIDHINFQLITNRSFKNDSVFCSQAKKTQCAADGDERFLCAITVFRIFRSRSHKRRDTGVLSHYCGSCKARPCWTTQCYGAASVLRKCWKLKAPSLFLWSFCRCFIAFFWIIKLYVIALCE